MKKPKPLNYRLLRQKIKHTQLGFETTVEIKLLTDFVGQERALEALNFGITIQSQGYNLYAMGPSGLGKRSLIKRILTEYASHKPVPSDWCYIHNFAMPEKPLALQLPPGAGAALQQEMRVTIEELCARILSILESDEYRLEMKKIEMEFNKKRKEKKDKIDKYPKLFKEQHAKEKALQLTMVNAAADPIFSKLKKKYETFSEVVNYLIAVQDDIVNHVSDFIKPDEKTNLLTFSLENPALTKYKVNLVVDNSQLKGAPVIFEESPSYSTVVCRVEHTTHFGVPITNFTLIKPGSLHHANGGYLILEARKIKKNHEVWEALKSALYSRSIKIKPIEHESDAVKPFSLEPMPIPLNVKVIILGDRNTYYSFCQHDPDFMELFKVAVDFDEHIARDKKNIQLFVSLVSTIVHRKGLRPFHASAVAEILEHSMRLAEDTEKFSISLRDIQDLMLESDYWASVKDKKIVERVDVKQAIDTKIHRMDRVRELYYEDIRRHFIIINTEGAAVGQINCLSVRKVGHFSFGHPTRVTARVRLGKGKIIDIQREIKLAGPLHSKAALIITNFISSRFAPNQLFSLYASLSFEQIYCWTDGDSASVGELCALLSALADVPIKQGLAVTGSIDQYGEVQAIGGVNEKVEGFFDVCATRGFDGNQGVIIPSVNQKNLMLREDIVEAAKQKKFFIYPISTVDEAIYLLTGVSAGRKDRYGNYPKDTVFYKIEKRLQEFSRRRMKKNIE